jgi:hypothetical protein
MTSEIATFYLNISKHLSKTENMLNQYTKHAVQLMVRLCLLRFHLCASQLDTSYMYYLYKFDIFF